MFAKLAKIRALGPGMPRQASAESRNDAAFRPASRRVSRNALICCWHHAHGTGALECVWHQAAVSARDQPQTPPTDVVGPLIDIHAAAGCSLHRAAA
jgi:hypothetical protein